MSGYAPDDSVIAVLGFSSQTWIRTLVDSLSWYLVELDARIQCTVVVQLGLGQCQSGIVLMNQELTLTLMISSQYLIALRVLLATTWRSTSPSKVKPLYYWRTTNPVMLGDVPGRIMFTTASQS